MNEQQRAIAREIAPYVRVHCREIGLVLAGDGTEGPVRLCWTGNWPSWLGEIDARVLEPESGRLEAALTRGLPDLSDAACLDALERWAAGDGWGMPAPHWVRHESGTQARFSIRLHALYALVMERFSGQGTGDWSRWKELPGATESVTDTRRTSVAGA